MSLKADKYLSQLESANSSHLTQIIQHVESIIEMVKRDGEKTKKPNKEIMEIHGMVFASHPAVQVDIELYNQISSRIESYVKQVLAPEYFDSIDGDTQRNLKSDLLDKQKLTNIFISHINTIKKLSVWLGLAFKAYQTPQCFLSEPINYRPFHMFRKFVYEHEQVRPTIDSFLESEVKQPGPDPPKGKGVAVHKTLIKAFVLMGYNENTISDSLKPIILMDLMTAIDEERKRTIKGPYDTLTRYSTSSRTSYSANSSLQHVPYNNYPYKAESGHVGLKNLGATCYLNSLIQSLYMTPAFRRAVFNWRYDPSTDKPEKDCIALQLQKLFAKLHLSECKALDTTDLTQSFGWDMREISIQHDVQELFRVLFDALSQETNIPISQLYEGHTQDYVICQKCHRVGGGKDKYLDLQLVVRNIQHLNEAIENYQFEELLSGENQYFCEKCSAKVDGLKGVKLLDLPDILTLHLKRFDIDFTTWNRVKLNNEVIFPQTLDMNKYMKSSNDLKVSDIDSKHNIYNLFAVLMHTGGAAGGHYYAFIKDKDSWFKFDDTEVTRMDERDIEKAYGGNQNANAYMLMYVRQYPVSPEHISLMGLNLQEEIELIPEQIRREIEQQNIEYRKGQREYELKKDNNKIKSNIYFKGQRHELSLEAGKTVRDLLQLAYEKIVSPNTYQITDMHLRLYDTQKRIPRALLDNDLSLMDIDFMGRERNILLEPKPDFIDYNPSEEVLVHTIKYSNDGASSSSFDPEESVIVPKTCTTSELKRIMSNKYRTLESGISIVYEKFVNNEKQQHLMTEDESGNIQELYGIQEGDVLYIEEVNAIDSHAITDPESSQLIQKLEEIYNTIVIRFDTIGQDLPAVLDHVVRIDKRKTIADLKLEIASIIAVDVDDFKLSYGRADNSYSLKDLEERLNQFANGTKLYVRRGKQMSSQQYNVTFYLMEDERQREEKRRWRKQEEERKRAEELNLRFPGVGHTLNDKARSYNSGNSAPSYPRRIKWEDDEDEERDGRVSSTKFSKWFDTVLNKSDTVADIKNMLLEKAKREQAAYVENDSTDFIRLREKLHGRNYPGKVLLNDEEPFISLATTALSAVPNREIIIERLTYPESLSQHDMILRIARWYPSKWTIGRVREIIIGRDNTLAELKQFIQPFFNYGNENQVTDHTPVLQLKKIPYHTIAQLRNSEFMLRLDWNDKNLNDTSVVTREPWYLADADLILYRDERERDWFSLHNHSSPLSNGTTTSTEAAAAASVADRIGGAKSASPVGSAASVEAERQTYVGSLYNRGERALKFYNTTEKKTTGVTPTTPQPQTPLSSSTALVAADELVRDSAHSTAGDGTDNDDLYLQGKKRPRDESHAEEGSTQNKLPTN